jgi:uncharacterized membrane-anchored protein
VAGDGLAAEQRRIRVKVKGVIRLDKKTKNLAQRIRHAEIALIDHEDLDAVSAQMLIDARVAAVVNASRSISGRYPNSGPSMLLEAGIPILDNVGPDVFKAAREGEHVEIDGDVLRKNGTVLGKGDELTREAVQAKLEECKLRLNDELERFAENTLTYVLKERSLLLDPTALPELKTKIAGRHALIVVRGEGYKDDLAIIQAYLRDVKPVLIAVDGGADALLELGLKPDIIVGDMDSISDAALKCGAEIVVHVYADKKRDCPGLERLRKLGLPHLEAAVPGTSEDVAMLIAYEKGAELIVAVGTHSNLIDFLDKGRRGMSSTFLVRLKVGSRLVDARGVSKLYRSRTRMTHLWKLVAAVLFVIVVVVICSPKLQDQVQSALFEVRLWFWHMWVKLRLFERLHR